MKFILKTGSAAAMLTILLPVLNSAAGTEISGYSKSFLSIVSQAPYINSGEELTLADARMFTQRLRLNLNHDIRPGFRFAVSYDFIPMLHNHRTPNTPLAIPAAERYRLTDLNSRIYQSGGNFEILQNLDRLLLKITLGAADIYAGRQAIAWGNARMVNPTDILAPARFDALDTEDRAGVDALRLRIPTGDMSEIDTGYAMGAASNVFYIRTRFYSGGNDIAFTFAGFGENLLSGIDISRTIGGALFWAETAGVFTDIPNTLSLTKKNHYLRTTAGCDYALSGKIYGVAEYHYNSAGQKEPESYPTNLEGAAYREGGGYLLGRHYLNAGLNAQTNPLIILTGRIMVNLDDRSVFIAPAAEYNVVENMYIDAGVYMGCGRLSEIEPAGNFKPNSEFGAYPDIYFAALRIYF